MLKPTGTDPANVRRADLLPLQKGVPLPDARLRRGVIRDTLRAMSISREGAPGESFVVKDQSVAAVYDNAKKLGIKVLIVALEDKSGYRVWRVT
jgi:hypothetical protein